MQRARAAVDERLPERSQQETLRSLGDDEIRAIVERYIEAWNRGDVDAVVAMLAEEATFSMPPNFEWFRGREAIREFLPLGPLSIPRVFVPVRANGQVAFGTYKLIDGEWLPNAIHVVTLDALGRDRGRRRVPGCGAVSRVRSAADAARALTNAPVRLKRRAITRTSTYHRQRHEASSRLRRPVDPE